MATKEELIKQCRYYKGEDECPEELRSLGYHLGWICEKEWISLEIQDGFEKGTFDFPYSYPIIWEKHIEIPSIDGYDIPINLLRMLYSFYCYFSGCLEDEIESKEVDLLRAGEWIRVNIKEGFKDFLENRYYSGVSKSHSNTK